MHVSGPRPCPSSQRRCSARATRATSSVHGGLPHVPWRRRPHRDVKWSMRSPTPSTKQACVLCPSNAEHGPCKSLVSGRRRGNYLPNRATLCDMIMSCHESLLCTVLLRTQHDRTRDAMGCGLWGMRIRDNWQFRERDGFGFSLSVSVCLVRSYVSLPCVCTRVLKALFFEGIPVQCTMC